MRRIAEVRKGDLVRLNACGWQAVLGTPYINEDGRVYVAFQILLLRLPQLLMFDWREEFEVDRRTNEP